MSKLVSSWEYTTQGGTGHWNVNYTGYSPNKQPNQLKYYICKEFVIFGVKKS